MVGTESRIIGEAEDDDDAFQYTYDDAFSVKAARGRVLTLTPDLFITLFITIWLLDITLIIAGSQMVILDYFCYMSIIDM